MYIEIKYKNDITPNRKESNAEKELPFTKEPNHLCCWKVKLTEVKNLWYSLKEQIWPGYNKDDQTSR